MPPTLSRDGDVDDELSFASKVIIREEVEFKDNVSPTRVRSEAIRAVFPSVRRAQQADVPPAEPPATIRLGSTPSSLACCLNQRIAIFTLGTQTRLVDCLSVNAFIFLGSQAVGDRRGHRSPARKIVTLIATRLAIAATPQPPP